MTMRGSADAKVLCGGYDVTPILSKFEDEAAMATEDNTPLGQSVTTEAFVGVTENGVVTVEGWYDDVLFDPTTGVFLLGQPGAAQSLLVLPAGNAANRRAIIAPGMLQANVKRIIEKPALTKASVEFKQAGGRVLYGQCIAHHIQRSTAGNTDADDSNWGASSALGAWFVVNVTQLALGGYTNLQMTLRDSADGTSWLAVAGTPTLTFTTVGAQYALFTGTLRQYVSLAWTWTGAGSGMTFTAAAAVGRNPA